MNNHDRKMLHSQSFTNFFFSGFFIFSIFLFLFLSQTAPALAEDPLRPIEETVEEILTILRSDDEVEWAKTREKISQVIQKRFDFQEQSRLVLAAEWGKINKEQKEQFIFLFSKLQEHVYLNRLKDYSDEKVHFTKQIVKKDKAAVFSVIVKDAEEIPIVYRMKKKQDTWFVYDVIIDGVSLVKNYRKQFSSIIENEKFSGLIVKMEEKIEQIMPEEEKKPGGEKIIE